MIVHALSMIKLFEKKKVVVFATGDYSSYLYD
jgi:hypothetical protein